MRGRDTDLFVLFVLMSPKTVTQKSDGRRSSTPTPNVVAVWSAQQCPSHTIRYFENTGKRKYYGRACSATKFRQTWNESSILIFHVNRDEKTYEKLSRARSVRQTGPANGIYIRVRNLKAF